MKYVLPYAVALMILLVLDVAWIGLIGHSFYAGRIGSLMFDRPILGYVALFYLLYASGIVYFAVSSGLKSRSLIQAAANGGLFGFFCYMTYDLTNLSTLKGYEGLIAVVDIFWGAISGAIVAGATVAIVNLIRRKPA